MTFFIGARLCRAPNPEKVKMALSLDNNILIIMTLILIRSSPRDCEMTFFIGARLCRAPNPEKVKMALSLELSGIL